MLGRLTQALHRLCTLIVLLATGFLPACESGSKKAEVFSFLPPDSTGVTFVNDLHPAPNLHLFTYEYFYNGGGVAAGDIDGDGLPDLYFTANMGADKLYLNQGQLRFKDITEAAGVTDTVGWTTGVTMADVNGDGHLDIYVCKAGDVPANRRQNRLYINDGDGVFTERAAEYGLDASTYSTHATFFDYDRDGDLDLYVLSHPPFRESPVHGQRAQWRKKFARDRLYRNDIDSSGTGTFVNVTKGSGLEEGPPGFGLSATVSDINRDGWPDLYIANDYEEEDRLYINQKDGTFSNALRDWLDHISASSMGADIADYDNDGAPDIFVADMLPEDNRRQKLLRVTQTPANRRNIQYMRNTLQLNNRNGSFSEIGQLAGVSNTDWSWSALFADFDLDGLKDLYVTNGIRKDATNLDFLHEEYFPVLMSDSTSASEMYKLVDQIPSTSTSNYVFRNTGDLTFETKSAQWGVAQKGFSNGAAYADLDVDGDLDLVVNNIDDPAWIYRNNTIERTDARYLRVKLEGSTHNRFGIGSKIELTTPEGETLFREMNLSRGFQSSVPPVASFGLGTIDSVDVAVTWPDQRRQHIRDVRTNQAITLHQEEAKIVGSASATSSDQHFVETDPDVRGLSFVHQENPYEDYQDQPLMTHMLARLGPATARGDVNGDGLDDIFVGGARNQRSILYLQQENGSFESASLDAFEADKSFEDVDATFLDIDGDGNEDLYVVSGGRSEVRPEAYQDRVYVNDGTGALEARPDALPVIQSSGGTVAVHDYDGDGDVDVFVGGRVRPLQYPLSPRSYLLENKEGQFEDVTAQIADALENPGMVSDAQWQDLTGDGTKELILTGEWMPIRVFKRNKRKTFVEISDQLGLENSNGWWNCIAVTDLDEDGDYDIVAGNRGENSQIQADSDRPASVYAADFDEDGKVESIVSHFLNGTEYPVPRRSRMMQQFSLFPARFPTYESYAEATLGDVLREDQWKKAERFKAHTFTTTLFEQKTDGTFVRHDLPTEAQFSPTQDIVVYDVTGNGRSDLLLAGNDFTVRRPWGPMDAGKGVLLVNQGDLTFDVKRSRKSGFVADGDVRSMQHFSTEDAELVLVGNNDRGLDLFEIH